LGGNMAVMYPAICLHEVYRDNFGQFLVILYHYCRRKIIEVGRKEACYIDQAL
jgi:hypothetical protein